MSRRTPLDGNSAERCAEILKAIAHPVRLRIIDALTCGESCVTDLESTIDVKQAIVSQQLKILRMSSLVQVDRRDGRAYYRLAEKHLTELMQCLRKCE